VDVGRPRMRLQISDEIGNVDLDIGVDEEEFGGTNVRDANVDDGRSESSETADETESQRDPTEAVSESSDNFIAELNEELKEAISGE